MKNDRKYYNCMPEKIMALLPNLENTATGEIPHFKGSYLKELITLIALHIHKGYGETRLKAAFIKKLIPDYKKYIDFLIKQEIIQRSRQYIPGEISYSYSFTPESISR